MADRLPEGVFWEGDGLVLRCSRTPPDGTFDLLDSVVWGTTGARFRIPGSRERVGAVTDVAWVAMEEGGALIGVYGLQERARTWNGEVVPMVYRTALAIHPDHLDRHLGGVLVRETRAFVLRHLRRGVVWGVIENDNARSLVLSERVGYVRHAELQAIMMSWRRPRAVEGVRRLRDDERPWFVAALGDLYAGHGLADFEQSARVDRSWVLEEGGQIVAALMADPQRWVIEDLGFGGWARRLLPYVPVYGDFIDPDDFRYAWIQHLWFGDRGAEALYRLIEGVFHVEQRRVAPIMGDPRSPVWQAFRSAGRVGWLAPLRYGLQITVGLVGVEPHQGPLAYTLNGV